MTAALEYVRTLARRPARKAKRDKQWWQVGPYRHRGVAYYDKQRLAKALPPMPTAEYSAPPSWAQLPESWAEWDSNTPANYFHNGSAASESAATDQTSAVKETSEYTLIHNPPGWGIAIGESYIDTPWTLTFADGATFDFTSRAIADAALVELLKIRKRHNRRAESGPQFTRARLRKPPADVRPEQAADDTQLADDDTERE